MQKVMISHIGNAFFGNKQVRGSRFGQIQQYRSVPGVLTELLPGQDIIPFPQNDQINILQKRPVFIEKPFSGDPVREKDPETIRKTRFACCCSVFRRGRG